jgi:hypothetical protein
MTLCSILIGGIHTQSSIRKIANLTKEKDNFKEVLKYSIYYILSYGLNIALVCVRTVYGKLNGGNTILFT